MKNSIALIGFMGTGKTAVGKHLAAVTGKEHIEMDDLVEQKAGKSIPRIFEEDTEIGFREFEIAVTKEVATKQNAVIVCGGGVVLNKINIDRLKKECIIVCLTASPEVILQRTAGETDARPMLKRGNKAQQVRELLRFREPFYQRAADITINTSAMDIDTVVEQIIKRLKRHEDFSLQE